MRGGKSPVVIFGVERWECGVSMLDLPRKMCVRGHDRILQMSGNLEMPGLYFR